MANGTFQYGDLMQHNAVMLVDFSQTDSYTSLKLFIPWSAALSAAPACRLGSAMNKIVFNIFTKEVHFQRIQIKAKIENTNFTKALL